MTDALLKDIWSWLQSAGPGPKIQRAADIGQKAWAPGAASEVSGETAKVSQVSRLLSRQVHRRQKLVDCITSHISWLICRMPAAAARHRLYSSCHVSCLMRFRICSCQSPGCCQAEAQLVLVHIMFVQNVIGAWHHSLSLAC